MPQPGQRNAYGLFLNPVSVLAWDTAKWCRTVQEAADLGVGMLVLQWTCLNGRTWYRSEEGQAHHLRRTEDPVGLLLELAEAAGLQVLLGTDASTPVAERHYDQVWASLARHQQVSEELAAHYAGCKAFRGFYLAREFDGTPQETERTFLSGAVRACRRARADSLVCWSIRRPTVPLRGRNYQTHREHPLSRLEEARLESQWAEAWGRVLAQVAPEAVLLRDDIGTRRNTWEQTASAGAALRAQCDRAGIELWAQCGLYEVMRPAGGGDPSMLLPAQEGRAERQIQAATEWAQRVFLFGFDDLDASREVDAEARAALRVEVAGVLGGGAGGEGAPLSAAVVRDRSPDLATDALLAKALLLTAQLRQHHLYEGQVVSVLNTEAPIVSAENEWQEDADWLTGLYTAAESFRFATTGEEEARGNAR